MFKLDLEKEDALETLLKMLVLNFAKEFQKMVSLFYRICKAFRGVDHEKLQVALKEMGVPQHFTVL